MSFDDDIRARVRMGTRQEREAVALILGGEALQRRILKADPDDVPSILLEAVRNTRTAGSYSSYGQLLRRVAAWFAWDAAWSPPTVPDTAPPDAIEEYIITAAAFAYRADRGDLPPHEAARMQERATLLLQGASQHATGLEDTLRSLQDSMGQQLLLPSWTPALAGPASEAALRTPARLWDERFFKRSALMQAALVLIVIRKRVAWMQLLPTRAA